MLNYETSELNDAELEAVNGGNFFLGVLAGVLGNEISKVLNSDGPVKGGVLEGVLNWVNKNIP